MADLHLEVITPEGVKLDERVDEVVAPSVNGEFGVLPGHLPMLAALNIGLLHYAREGKTTDVAVGTGFAEVLGDKTLILTDRFITRDEVDVLPVRARLRDVDEELERWDGAPDDPRRLELVEEEQWLATQLELYGDPPPPRVLELRRAADFSGVLPGALEDAERGDDEADDDDHEDDREDV
ncbi:MAG: ATP synthase F1 subunit epsilon [Myxococcota bacterium]